MLWYVRINGTDSRRGDRGLRKGNPNMTEIETAILREAEDVHPGGLSHAAVATRTSARKSLENSGALVWVPCEERNWPREWRITPLGRKMLAEATGELVMA